MLTKMLRIPSNYDRDLKALELLAVQPTLATNHGGVPLGSVLTSDGLVG
ncbi:hypothetical protein [Cognatiyoonia sp. IB215182]|nr:hypothetical protein [Cognatiyoonia sp. IB215182]MDX8355819.1 hypothetical protein [Cognatiyoonia sp. IB215182]